jgi:hypothetical protein
MARQCVGAIFYQLKTAIGGSNGYFKLMKVVLNILKLLVVKFHLEQFIIVRIYSEIF